MCINRPPIPETRCVPTLSSGLETHQRGPSRCLSNAAVPQLASPCSSGTTCYSPGGSQLYQFNEAAFCGNVPHYQPWQTLHRSSQTTGSNARGSFHLISSQLPSPAVVLGWVELSWIGCLTSQLTIFQSYMWRHIDVQAVWRRSLTYGLAPNAIDIS